MKKVIVLEVILMTIFSFGFAQPYFQKSFDFNNLSDYGHFITNDGNDILILSLLSCTGGSATCTGILKLDSLGNEIWRNVIAIPNENLTMLTISPSKKKSYLVAGHNYSPILKKYKSWIGEVSNSGTGLLWSNTFENTQNERTEEIWEKDDGGYFLGVEKFDTQSIHEYKSLLALDDNRNPTGEKKLLIPGLSRHGFGNILYPGNERILTSGHHQLFNEFGIAYQRITKLNMFDTLGTMLWSVTLPDTLEWSHREDYPVKARQTADGNFVIVSAKDSANLVWHNLKRTNASLYKIDTLGRILWSYFFISGDVKHTYGLKAAKNGDVIGCGYSNIPIAANDRIDVSWLYRISSDGKLLWERYFYSSTPGHLPEGYLWDLTELEDGSIAATGMKIDTTRTGSAINIWLLKTDSQGCIIPGCSDRDVVFTNLKEADNALPHKKNFKNFPNPATSKIYVEFYDPFPKDESFLKLIDIFGREIISKKINKKELSDTSFNLDGLAKGIYLITFESKGKILQSEKIIIQ